jgi:hypothetical protein
MPERELGVQRRRSALAPEELQGPRVNEAPRINVAFPFSNLQIQEPSQDLAALANLVEDITALLVSVAPGTRADELKERAGALVEKLR